MPDYEYRVMDAAGATIDGVVSAADVPGAVEEVAALGYGIDRLEIRPAAGPAGQVPPAPVDLTQLLPGTAAQQVAPPLDLTAGYAEPPAPTRRLEPWERGGPVPQPPPPPAPTVSMTAAAIAPPTGGVPSLPPAPGGSIPERAEISLAQVAKERLVYPVASGTALKDLSAFYRQFATLIHAGLPTYQSLAALSGNTQNPKLKEVATEAMRRVQAGGRLSDTLAAYPWIFPPMHIEMIRGAEYGGMIEEVFKQLAGYVDHEIAIRRTISYETLYPKIVVFMALMLLGRTFLTSTTPAIALLVLGGMGHGNYSAGDYFRDTIGFGLLCAAPFVAAAIAFRLSLFNVTTVRETYDGIKLGLPVIGPVVRLFVAAKFVRTFAAMYRAGFGMPSALKIAGDSCGNAVARRAAYSALGDVERGGLVSAALEKSRFFPALALDMLRTGELTGSLDETLDKVADFYEAEGKSKSHVVAMIFSVIVFLIVAIFVFIALLQFYGHMGAGVSAAGAGGD